jgi:hypothetical protein
VILRIPNVCRPANDSVCGDGDHDRNHQPWRTKRAHGSGERLGRTLGAVTGHVWRLGRARGRLDRLDGVLKLSQVPPHRLLRVQTDFARVRSQKAAQEYRLRQLLELIRLDTVENPDGDLRRARELIDRDPAALARFPQICPYIDRLSRIVLSSAVRSVYLGRNGHKPVPVLPENRSVEPQF